MKQIYTFFLEKTLPSANILILRSKSGKILILRSNSGKIIFGRYVGPTCQSRRRLYIRSRTPSQPGTLNPPTRFFPPTPSHLSQQKKRKERVFFLSPMEAEHPHQITYTTTTTTSTSSLCPRRRKRGDDEAAHHLVFPMDLDSAAAAAAAAAHHQQQQQQTTVRPSLSPSPPFSCVSWMKLICCFIAGHMLCEFLFSGLGVLGGGISWEGLCARICAWGSGEEEEAPLWILCFGGLARVSDFLRGRGWLAPNAWCENS